MNTVTAAAHPVAKNVLPFFRGRVEQHEEVEHKLYDRNDLLLIRVKMIDDVMKKYASEHPGVNVGYAYNHAQELVRAQMTLLGYERLAHQQFLLQVLLPE